MPPPEVLKARNRRNGTSANLRPGWGGIANIVLNEDIGSFRKIIYQIRPDLVAKLDLTKNIKIGKVSILQTKNKNAPKHVK